MPGGSASIATDGSKTSPGPGRCMTCSLPRGQSGRGPISPPAVVDELSDHEPVTLAADAISREPFRGAEPEGGSVWLERRGADEVSIDDDRARLERLDGVAPGDEDRDRHATDWEPGRRER